MKVIVFGASGKVGRQVVELLLDSNHKVTAFVYGSNPFQPRANLGVVQGDVKNGATVVAALSTHDAVVSTLGSWGTNTKDILSTGMRSIIPAMEQHGVVRIVSLTGADALLPKENPSFMQRMSRLMLGIVAGKILKDGERHLELLASSALDWTVVRSPVMNESGSELYELSNNPTKPWQTIHRHAVAKAMVDVLENGSFTKQAPIIHRK